MSGNNPLDANQVSDLTALTPQYVQNLSFDPTFNLLAVELVAYDRTANVMRRVELVESTTAPGSFVLAVGNIDGSPITGGTGGTGGTSTPGTGVNNLLVASGENLLLDSTSVLLI